MHLFLLLFAVAAHAQFTQPLATGVRLDPVGEYADLGSMPIGLALAPGGARGAVVLSGWREQGVQIADLKSRTVTQTLKQEAAFYGASEVDPIGGRQVSEGAPALGVGGGRGARRETRPRRRSATPRRATARRGTW